MNKDVTKQIREERFTNNNMQRTTQYKINQDDSHRYKSLKDQKLYRVNIYKISFK